MSSRHIHARLGASIACLAASSALAAAPARASEPMALGSAPQILIQKLGQQSPPSAVEVEMLAEHDGISIEQATRSLEVQHQAGDLSTELRAVLGDDFAGVWYDRKAATFQIAIVDGHGENAARQLVDSKQIPARFVPVRHTYAELAGIAVRWTTAHPDLTARAAMNVNVDVERNTVIARVADDAPVDVLAELRAEAENGTPEALRIETVPAQQLKLRSLACNVGTHGCDEPMRGGIAIGSTSGTCTGGFMTQGNGGANYFLLTAGHCLSGSARNSTVVAYDYGGRQIAFGVVHRWVNDSLTGQDAGIVRWANSGWGVITNSVVA